MPEKRFNSRGSTLRRRRFIMEYMIDLNATQAAIRAGYSPKTAYNLGSQMLSDPAVWSQIEEGQALLAKKHGVTVDRIINELAKIGFANMADYMVVGPDGAPRLNWSALTRDQAAALVEVTVEQVGALKVGEADGADVVLPVHKIKFKLGDKRAALVDLGKHLNMFVERHQTEVRIKDERTAIRDRVAKLFAGEPATRPGNGSDVVH